MQKNIAFFRNKRIQIFYTDTPNVLILIPKVYMKKFIYRPNSNMRLFFAMLFYFYFIYTVNHKKVAEHL